MRNHIQGAVLLVLLAAALWGTTRLAGPILGDAFGDDGAVQAQSAEDRVELSSVADDRFDEPLTSEEVFTIQWQLGLEGFLDVETDLDGLMGPTTRRAMQDAKVAYGMTQASDRALLEHLDELFAELFAEPIVE